MTAVRGRYAPTPPPPFPGKVPDTTVYPYPWNKAREAIGVDRASLEDIAAAAREEQAREQLDEDIKHATHELPLFLRMRIEGRIDEACREKTVWIARLKFRDFVRRELPLLKAVNNRYRIHLEKPMPPVWSLLETTTSTARYFADLQGLTERFNRLPEYTEEDIELLSQDIAIFIRGEIADMVEMTADLDAMTCARQLYACALRIAEHFGMPPANAEKFRRYKLDLMDTSVTVQKMADEKIWKRRLKRLAYRWREHLQIAYGDVGRSASVYCSKKQISIWEEQRRRNRFILNNLELEDEDTGERISLASAIDASVSNPEHRRTELMTRIRGFRDIARSEGFEALFFTITSPGKYHSRLHYGPRNNRWNQSSPKQTQDYLNNIWKLIRTALARDGVQVFGLRVAEPHHDGTPHWHMMLFVRPEQKDTLIDTMRTYATREDRDELNTKEGIKPRFDVTVIDEEKGDAAAYIAKYISKNIDGYALDSELDDESGKPCKLTAKHATAWASLWGIRQFQFAGGAPVSVWRELRRMRDQELAKKFGTTFAELHQAASVEGNWGAYITLQGGPFVSRKDLTLRPYYELQKTANQYGEQNPVIKGLRLQLEPGTLPIITHVKKWKMVKKQPTPDTAAELTGCSSFDLTVASATAGTRVNNCTLYKKQPTDGEKTHSNTEPIQQTIDQQIISSLATDQNQNENAAPDGRGADLLALLRVIPPHHHEQKPVAGDEKAVMRLIAELRSRGIDDEDEIGHVLKGRMIGYGADSYLQARNGNIVIVRRQRWCGHRECHNPLNEEDLRYGDETRCLAHSDPERVAERRQHDGEQQKRQKRDDILARVDRLRRLR
ncbi:TPA: replication endonuclease [Klebsiella oxytoca]|uniref:Replication endonuclease n=1 Tax=Klebsiella oxytoca TaxID=571 RepID=A0AAN5LBD3_KLEOX|nr:replication endonuclease [Klebsiella oxytoca]